MAYNTISDARVQNGAIANSALFFHLRDNPIAIANGDSGAPRIVDAALDTGAATSAGTTWVNLRIAGGTAGGVGTYVFAEDATTTTRALGSTLAGSSLTPAGVYSDDQPVDVNVINNSFAPLSGTWQCMGYKSVGSAATLWMRIA